MKNNNKFVRFKRISWKSKNNVFLYRGEGIENLSKDFSKNIDILIVSEDFRIDSFNSSGTEIIRVTNDYNKLEVKEMIENIKKIDEIEVGEFVGKATIKAIGLLELYYWKNIIIFEGKED